LSLQILLFRYFADINAAVPAFLKKPKVRPEQLAPQPPAPDGISDPEFLQEIYLSLLGRGIDETGKLNYLDYLRQGNSRLSVILNIIRSDEFINKVLRENTPILSIREERPDRYSLVKDIHGRDLWVFRALEPGDYDWLEQKIRDNGYYEKPGVWDTIINEDKRVHAEIASRFQPRSVLDVGCANGPIIKCLNDMGVYAEGVDISRMALARAFPEIKERIYLGDILDVSFPRAYDLILALDIFEHLNPNKLRQYIDKMFQLLNKEGYLFANIPAFGHDAIFGDIFEVYISEWEEELTGRRCFRTIHTDEQGYPYNGHIIGAGSPWWVEQFERAGFRRETDVEHALHRKYDETMNRNSIARKSYYVFSKGAKSKGLVPPL
jgi:SAM-dependent methyltransferase